MSLEELIMSEASYLSLDVATMYTYVRKITGCNDDDLIGIMLDKSIKEIMAYLGKEYLPAYNDIAVDMTVIKINRVGTEGLSSQQYSGMSENYIDGYPADIINRLDRFKKKWGAL